MKKIKNNLLIKNILILLISGGITKIIGMFGKIIYTRQAGINVVSLYALITPTFMLILNICQFSFPISISKLSAENRYKDKDLLKNAYLISIIINIVAIIILIFSAEMIAKLLHNNNLKLPILSISLIIPFVTTSSIQRGFLHGKENMMIPCLSNIFEEIIKIILIIIILPIAISISNITAVTCIILFNIITELVSIITMQITINKNYENNSKAKLNVNIIKDIIKISVPTTSIRLISSFGFFLEPIILTSLLVKQGFNTAYITLEYGIINSYVLPLLSMPSFFSMSIASALLPNITKAYANNRYKDFKDKLFALLILSIIVGIICLSLILIFPSQILKLIYKIDIGINYIYLIGPFFIFIYMQPCLSVAVQAMNMTNKLLYVTTTSITLKFLTLVITTSLRFGINSLIYSLIIGILTTTLLTSFIVIKKIARI